MDQASSKNARSFLSKKVFLWALVSIGVVDGLGLRFSPAHGSLRGGEQLLAMFAMNVAILGWCFQDAEERRAPIAGWLRLAMLALPIIGLPWYFLQARGVVGAAKAGFGLGLFAIWIMAMMITVVAVSVAQTLLTK